MTIFAPIYQAFAAIGFTDPLHPALTHLPIGLVVAALSLWMGSLLWRHYPAWRVSAQHCLILAWLFFFPTVLLGYMDWQYYYQGVWIFPIKAKIILAIVLFILLSSGVILIFTGRGESRAIPIIYTFSFITVVALGYFGGHMVYGGRIRATPEEFQKGMTIFDANCSACHPNGGNALRPNLPLRGSSYLENQEQFRAFLRNPRLKSGERGAMPAFPPGHISDREARELYRYLTHEYGPLANRGG